VFHFLFQAFLAKSSRGRVSGTEEKDKRRGEKGRSRRREANAQDDKVGAALSMTYVTGQPILFVGCGQTYTDLRHLRVNHIVQALLS